MPKPTKEPEDTGLNHDLFPLVQEDDRPRRLYFEILRENDRQLLVEKGYDPVALMTLPRRNSYENQVYLLAKAQGIEEGTVWASSESRRQLELSMQAYQMLHSKSVNVNMNIEGTKDDLREVLSWQQSRHTLRGNTTVQATLDPKDPGRLQRESEIKLDAARKKAEAKVKGLHDAEARGLGVSDGKSKKRSKRATKSPRKSKKRVLRGKGRAK
jgi:hypothetical protein